MATRRKKKCKNGLRRDGKCRRTKCRRKLTKGGYCPKGAGSGTSRRRGRSTRRKTSRRKSTGFAQALWAAQFERAQREGRPFTKKFPGRIGGDPRSRANYGRTG